MGHVRTSTFFYRRGVPNQYYFFGQAVLGNWPVIQPQRLFNSNTISSTFSTNIRSRY